MRCGNDGNGNRLKVKGCNVSFLLNPEQRHKRHPPRVYADALFRALQGASYSEVAQGLRHTYHIDKDEGTIRRWVIAGAYRASRYLLSLPLQSSGFIYLDEKTYTVHHTSEGRKWREDWWIWNSYDQAKKVWFESLIRKGRGENEAYELIQATLAKAIPPDNGEIYLWCDGLDKYQYAFERLVREGKIDPAKIHLVPISKKKEYSCINEIEGLNSRIEEIIKNKLKPSIDEAGAQVRIDGERVQYLFVERIPEFGDKTRAMNAGVDLRLGDSEWEKIATLTQILKLQKFKNYELKVNVSDTQALKEMKTGRNDDPAYHVTNPEGNASDTEAHRDGPDRGTESNEGKPASSCALDQPNQDQKTDAPNESVVTKGHETECYNNLNTSRSVRVPYVTSFKIYL